MGQARSDARNLNMYSISYIYEFLKYDKGLGGRMSEVTEDWRRWRKEKFRDCSLSIFRVIKSIRMQWVGNVARVGDRRGAYRVLGGDLRGRDHLEDLG